MRVTLFHSLAFGARIPALLLATGSLLALPLATATAASDVLADSDYWRVVEVVGDARMLAGANPWNQEAPLAPGDVIGPYQAIVTGVGATVILVRGEDIIVVYANTTLALPAPAEDGTATYIQQPEGDAFYAVDPRPAPDFTVETPYLIAGVKGTEFSLAEDGGWLAVLDGVVGARDQATGAMADMAQGWGIEGTGGGAGGFVPSELSQRQLSALADQRAWVEARRATWQRSAADQQQGERADAATLVGGAGADASETAAAVDATAAPAETLSESLAALGGTLAAVGATAGAAVNSAGSAVGETVSAVGTAAANAVGGIGAAVSETVGGAVGNAGGTVAGAVGNASGAMGNAIGTVSGTVGAAVSGLGGAIGGGGSASSASGNAGGGSTGGNGSSGGDSGNESGGSGNSSESGGSDSGSGSSSGGGLGGAVGNVVGGVVGGLL